MERLTIAAAALLPIGGWACDGSEGESTIHIVERDSSGITIVEIAGDIQGLPEWLLGDPLLAISGSRPPHLGAIGEVEWLSDGRIVVEDDQTDQIHLFAADGTHLRVLGAQGDGPGEFQNVTQTTVVAGDSVFLYDRSHDRLTVLDPDAGFVRSVQFGNDLGGRPPLDVYALRADRLIVQQYEWAPQEGGTFPRLYPHEMRLFLTDGRGRSIEGPVVTGEEYSAVMANGFATPLYSPRSIIAAASSRLAYGLGLRHEITVTDAEMRTRLIIRWDGWTAPIPKDELETVHRILDSLWAEYPPDIQQTFIEPLEEAYFAPHMLPEQRPALAWRSYIGPDGEIWLSRFRPHPLVRSTSPEWHVLSPEGRPLGRVTLPAGSTLAAVDDERVLLIVRDALDVESLEARALDTTRD